MSIPASYNFNACELSQSFQAQPFPEGESIKVGAQQEETPLP